MAIQSKPRICNLSNENLQNYRTHFSREGALNLLRDFEGVSEWIIACNYVRPEHVAILSKHEVLRTCEGVGKILLRKPFEIISMTAKTIIYTPNSMDANGKSKCARFVVHPFHFTDPQLIIFVSSCRSKC